MTREHPVAMGMEILRAVGLDDIGQFQGLQIGHEFVQAFVESFTDSFGEAQVDSGGGYIGMTENLLQDGDVFAVLQKMGGKGVAIKPNSA